MSSEALLWAAQQRTGSGFNKAVLLALADAVQPGERDWLAAPTIAELAEASEMDRKTVIAALDRLEAALLIIDTGERRGRTLQIKVYRLGDPLAGPRT